MIDINVDESATSVEKIIINSRSINYLSSNKNNNYNDYSTIKCYKSLPSITTLEAKSIHIIKIHKTIFLNLSNLVNIDLRDNKLLKISNNFKLFKNLKSLKLDLNQISFIPLFIGELTHLETFTISNNLITYIPTSIQNLTSLKVLNLSNNKIERFPIEFGQLSSLETLYIDGNYFMAIPTTICYLKRLSELSFDWLEFVEPPYYRIIKDSVGKTIICIIIKCLESMLKQSILYCDFKTFIEKISPKKSDESDNEKSPRSNNNKRKFGNKDDVINEEKNIGPAPFSGIVVGTLLSTCKLSSQNQINNKYMKIFHAIENHYYGVIKSFLESENVEEYLTVKNQENKTAFYVAINNKNDDIIDLFLEKIKEQKIQLNYLYLFKAIRTRNPELVKKLVNLGIKVDSTDDQGKGVFHILFSSFTKQIARCTLIGDFLLEKGAPVNLYDADNWAPIHLAVNKASKQCLLWIISSNKKLKEQGKEQFDLNLKGRNNWTPLHLAISSFRIEETLILLGQGCDIFARNIDAKTPKKVSLCNFVFSKLLSYYEFVRLREKYDIDDENGNENGKKHKNSKSMIDDGNINNIYKNEVFNHYSSFENNKISKNNDRIGNNEVLKKGETFNKLNLGNVSKDKSNINANGDQSSFVNNPNSNGNKNMKSKYNKNNNNKNGVNATSDKVVKHNNKIKNSNNNNNESDSNKDSYFNLPNEQKVADISSTFINEEPVNINIQKERLISSESCLSEKYESFMFIKLNKSCNSEIIRSMIDNMDLSNSANINIISDICNYILSNFMTSLIPTLKNLLTNKLLEKNSFIKKEIKNTINILEKVNNNVIIPVNKQKTKVSSKSIKNHKFDDDDDDGGKFLQDSEIMNDDLIEDDNELNFDVMNEMWTKQENSQKEKNDKVLKENNNINMNNNRNEDHNKNENKIKGDNKNKNETFLSNVINQKNNLKSNLNNLNKQKQIKKIKSNTKK